MMIEFTGMVGSGKSTIAAEFKRLLREQGVAALEPAEASMRCFERSRLGQAVGALAPRPWRGQCLRAALRLVELWHRLVFALAHRRLVWPVLLSQRRRQIPWWHRWIIVGLFFEVAGRYQFLRGRLLAGEAAVFEEGLVHRAINLFAWEPRVLDVDAVTSYFGQLPALDLIVLVRAPLDVCLARAGERGLPLRLRDKDKATIDRFMAHSDTIVELGAAFLRSQTRQLIEIDNGGALDDTLASLRERASASPVFQQRPARGWMVSSVNP
jgi:hypothetical protein